GVQFEPARVSDGLLSTILTNWKITRTAVRFAVPQRRFPPPWSVDDPDTKLGQDCYIVRDGNGHPLAYVYFEDEPGRRSAAHLMTRDEVRRIAVNIAKLP